MRNFLKLCGAILMILVIGIFALSYTPIPKQITYGLSFNKIYADELGLPWRDVYYSILDDLQVKNLRLAAHWTVVEPEQGKYDFSVMDEEMNAARDRGVSVIFGVGRRLPRWPECHVPDWAKSLSWDDQKVAITDYITTVVNRYKDYDNIFYWQVENEPFFTKFAQDSCGTTLDEKFLEQEVALVKKLDPTRPILVTDSGNVGLWYPAYNLGDAFGTSIYLYVSNELTGPIKSLYQPWMYRFKENLVQLFRPQKPVFLIELSLEPWLDTTITQAPISLQLERMNTDRFDEIITYAKKTNFERQYLWGAEWWYWMKNQGHPEFWEKAKLIFENK